MGPRSTPSHARNTAPVDTAFRTEDGLPAAAVYSICDDPGGDLWLGTNKGLARFDPERREVKSFGLSNGLRSLSFNLGSCGRTRDEILSEYPYLEAEDIAEALSYAAWRAEEVEVPLRQP